MADFEMNRFLTHQKKKIHYRANVPYLLEKDMNKNMNFAKLLTLPASKRNACWVFFLFLST